LVPWQEEDFNNAMYKVIGQDVVKLSEVVDVFSPMSYHFLCRRDIEWIISATQSVKSKTNKEVWPIIQLTDGMTLTEYGEALKAGLSWGSEGAIAFITNVISEYGAWYIHKNIFSVK